MNGSTWRSGRRATRDMFLTVSRAPTNVNAEMLTRTTNCQLCLDILYDRKSDVLLANDLVVDALSEHVSCRLNPRFLEYVVPASAFSCHADWAAVRIQLCARDGARMLLFGEGSRRAPNLAMSTEPAAPRVQCVLAKRSSPGSHRNGHQHER